MTLYGALDELAWRVLPPSNTKRLIVWRIRQRIAMWMFDRLPRDVEPRP